VSGQPREYVLTLSCPDRPGIVFAVSSYLIQHSGNILASQQYGEPPDGRFFMRVQFAIPAPGRVPRGGRLRARAGGSVSRAPCG